MPSRPEPIDDRRVPLAAIAGAHGIGGEVRLKLFAESIDSLRRHRRFDAAGRELALTGLRDGPQGPMLHAPDLSRADWQSRVTDAEILATIKNGRNQMPGFSGLPASVLDALVKRVRSLEAP